MKSADLQVEIGGQIVDFPLEAFDLKVTSDFGNDAVQPQINIEELTIFGLGVTIVNNHVASGNMYKGLPIVLRATNTNGVVSVLDAYINLPKYYEVFQDNTIKVGISKKNDLISINDRLASITWSVLENKGKIGNSDYTKVDYVVEKSNPYLDMLIMAVVLYIMVKELVENIKETIDLINKTTTAAVPSVGVGLVSNVGSIIYAVLSIILQVLYVALMLVAIVNMATQLFNLLVTPKRQHKMLNYRRGMEILANHLGLTFYSPIHELDDYYYLPSNNNVDGIDLLVGTIQTPKGIEKGYPNSGDYGFTGLEFTNLLLTMFEAKITVQNGVLIMRTKTDPFWKSQSNYVLPDIDIESWTTNADDIVFSTLVKFDTDPIADEYTLSNFKGTNYQVLVNTPSVSQGADDNFIKKHETVDFRVALGNRKDKLTPVENYLYTLGSTIDTLTGIFGGGTNLASKITSRIGALKVGTNNHTRAKLIYLKGGKIPSNHRDFTSAKYLWNNYINSKSFISNNFERQRKKFKLDTIPFGMNDFNLITNNGNFKLSDGTEAKMELNEWNVLNDVANIEFNIKFVYANNLTETYIEAE